MRNPTRLSRRRQLLLASALAAVTVLAGCGDDDDNGDDPPTTEADVDTTNGDDTNGDDTDGDDTNGDAAEGDVVTVTMDDYSYDIDGTLPLGTILEVVNVSPDEVHEVVLMRFNDDEDRPLAEFFAMGPDGEDELGAATEFLGVAFAAPDSDEGVYPYGPLTLDEPGRYGLFCAIPVGADPDEWLAIAAEGDGPPEVDGGPPHFVEGMLAEVEVS
jgi:hypothetical protein